MNRLAPYLESTGNCLVYSTPPCANVCPLNIELADFLEKCRSGEFSAAKKIYAKNAVLPGITCYLCSEPCARSCVRSGVDSPVHIRSLEQYCMLSAGTAGADFYIPRKKNSVLIVGSGPAGLACAAKLAGRGYSVRLAERAERLGGSLWDVDASILPEAALKNELKRIEGLKCLICSTGCEISEGEYGNYDAVIMATGCEAQGMSGTAEQGRDGIFYAGSLWNPALDTLSVIKQAAALTYDVESLFKTGRVAARRETDMGCIYVPDMAELKYDPCTAPAEPSQWDGETAMREASRCTGCKCSKCYSVCRTMQSCGKDSTALARDINTTVNKFFLNRKDGLRQISDCYQCGLCESVCPQKIDFGTLCLESRRFLHENMQYPDAMFDYWLGDMEHANGERARLLLQPEHKGASYLFFPGCQLSAAMPEYVPKIYQLLGEYSHGETAMLLQCCGIPALWAGQRELFLRQIEGISHVWDALGQPAILTACPSCQRTLGEYMPAAETRSLWDYLAQNMPQRADSGKRVYVFDPCASRDDPDMRSAVRQLLSRAGYAAQNAAPGRQDLHCCGFGGLLRSANPELFESICRENVGLSELPFLTYCSNCQDSFISQNKESHHILSIIFDEAESPSGCCDLSQRRINRERVKTSLLAGSAEPEAEWASIALVIPDEIRVQMNRELILDEYLQRAICSAVGDGTYALDQSSGICTATVQVRNTTYWVSYAAAGGSFRIVKVYRHRMKIGTKDE